MSRFPKVHPICVPGSFETNLQATNDIRFSGRVLLIRAKGVVTKALAGTDAGTVALKNAAGTTLATITIPLSSALDVEVSVDFPANTFIERDSYLRLDFTKTTAGGSANVFVEYQSLGE